MLPGAENYYNNWAHDQNGNTFSVLCGNFENILFLLQKSVMESRLITKSTK